MEATPAPTDLATEAATRRRGVPLWVIFAAMAAVQVAVVALFAPLIF